MTGNETLDLIIIISLGILFLATIITTMIYNPNYSVKEILKRPWLIFDLLKHSADELEERIDQAQDLIDQGKEIVQETKEAVEDVKETIDEIVEEVKEIRAPKDGE